jgi:D-xylose transport system ATP-binding protein
VSAPLLELRGINKSFGPVHVLRDVAFTAEAGVVTALYPIDSGDYTFEGKQVSVHSPRDAAHLGVEIVYQDLALCDNLDIVSNMFLGREKKAPGGIVLDDAAMEQMAAQTLASLSVRTVKSIRQQVSSLSGGQRQTVAIAKAVLWNSKLVILDEPTAALGVAQTAQVLELVRRLADNGHAVVLISHNLNDVFAVSDRIACLYLGQMVAQVKTTDVTHAQVVELITSGRSGNLGLPAEVLNGENQ